jgi:HD-GYP domain-containing protein (c-di-GMP phosphodiesterase class II)
VCDVFDALRTRRPYREAWPLEKVVSYLHELAGVEFDRELVDVFTRMMEASEARVAVLHDTAEAVPVAPEPAAARPA